MPKPDDKTPPQRIGVRKFRANLSTILRQARSGSTFLVKTRDVILTEIRPPSLPIRLRRQPGVLRGRIRMAPDLDVLPPAVVAAMECEGG